MTWNRLTGEVDLRNVTTGKGYVTLRRFQSAVRGWYDSLFRGTDEEHSSKTITMRFLEEALELCQARGLTPDDIVRQLNYTYSRPRGTVAEEIAGTALTFQHIANDEGLDIQDLAVAELKRVNTPEMRKKIYDKQAYKRDHGLVA